MGKFLDYLIEHEEEKFTTWIYKVETYNVRNFTDSDWEKKINSCSRNAWELDRVITRGNNYTHIYRRPSKLNQQCVEYDKQKSERDKNTKSDNEEL